MPARAEIAALRLSAQGIAASEFSTPGEVVRWMFAMQAQDFPGAKWSVGLRLPGSTDADVEAAIESRQFVRSWLMRGTLHFIAGEDLGWMLQLMTPRLVAGAAARRRQLELSDVDFGRAGEAAEASLTGGRVLERSAMLEQFERAGISTAGQRGYHILWHLAQTGLLVFGPVTGKQHTFALLNEWVRDPRRLDDDDALGELARRYFTSHGPATLKDLAWWASLTMRQARSALAIARPHLEEREFDGILYYLAPGIHPAPDAVHALPGFDEFMLGYQDRSAALAAEHSSRIVPGKNGMFLSTIVVNGEVTGTWRRAAKANEVVVTAEPFSTMTAKSRSGFVRAVKRYGEFIGKPVRVAD